MLDIDTAAAKVSARLGFAKYLDTAVCLMVEKERAALQLVRAGIQICCA